MCPAQSGEEEVAAPLRNSRRHVEGCSRRRDGGIDVGKNGVGQLVPLRRADRQGPAVVSSGAQDIDFVIGTKADLSGRSMLSGEEQALHGIERQALGVAMPVTED